MALSNCLLQLFMFGQKKGFSDDDFQNQKKYSKFLINMGMSKKYKIQHDCLDDESEFSFDAQKYEHESQRSDNENSPMTITRNQIAIALSKVDFQSDQIHG